MGAVAAPRTGRGEKDGPGNRAPRLGQLCRAPGSRRSTDPHRRTARLVEREHPPMPKARLTHFRVPHKPAGSPASAFRAALARAGPSRWWARRLSAALRSSGRQGAARPRKGHSGPPPPLDCSAASSRPAPRPPPPGSYPATPPGRFPGNALQAATVSAMDPPSGAWPRRPRDRLGAPSSGARAPATPWARFSAWLECVCVVTFDLELGQALEVSGGRRGRWSRGREPSARGVQSGRHPAGLSLSETLCCHFLEEARPSRGRRGDFPLGWRRQRPCTVDNPGDAPDFPREKPTSFPPSP